jgi:P-type E1-E2 ATPase
VPKADIVVGDIIEFSEGDNVFVDSLLISGQNISISESYVTGEWDLQAKEKDNICQNIRDSLSNTNNLRYGQVPSSVILSGSNVERG